MDKKYLLILLEVILLIILIMFNFALENRKNIFVRDCAEYYDLNDTCPCAYKPINPINQFGMLQMPNFSEFSTNLNNQLYKINNSS